MTLTEALRRLQAAGKIKSAWLPGMLVREDAFTMRLAYRTTGTWHCVYAHPEKPKMDGWLRVDDRQTVGWQPVLTDPATTGCLLALLREAWGRPEVSVAYDAEDQRWTLVAWDSEMGWRDAKPGWPLVGPTEGEAIAAALIALAGAA